MKLDASIAAIVTGGASGLGAATARRLAGHGVRIALFDMNAASGERLAGELGGIFCRVDVTSGDEVDAGFARSRGLIGQERVLVNCAGTANAFRTASRDRESGEVRHFPLDAFERVIQINLIGTFRCIAKSAAGMLSLPPLEDGERGVIINTASVAAEDGQIGQAAYSASKGGVVALTLPAAREFAQFGIRVMTIAPGIFKTPMMAGMPQQVQDSLAAAIPFPKVLGKPEQYADLALHIVENRYLNGEVIRLDGAIRMAPK